MSPITSQIAFVDYENFPSFFEGRDLTKYKQIFLFMGCRQKNMPVSLVKKLVKLEANIEIICVENESKNNADFHLIMYVGKLHAEIGDPQCEFTIFSNDTGYDDAITHLKKYLYRPTQRIMNAIR